MTTQIIRREATQVTGKERRSLREKMRNFYRKATDLLDTHSQLRLRYLEEKYGEDWWMNSHCI